MQANNFINHITNPANLKRPETLLPAIIQAAIMNPSTWDYLEPLEAIKEMQGFLQVAQAAGIDTAPESKLDLSRDQLICQALSNPDFAQHTMQLSSELPNGAAEMLQRICEAVKA